MKQRPASATAADVWGDRWIVMEARGTRHGFDVLLGKRPGAGRGGNSVICTRALRNHLAAHALTPSEVDLPIGQTALKHLRKRLDLGWWKARAAWWIAHKADLERLTIDAFVAKHGGSTGATCLARQRIVGKPQLRLRVGGRPPKPIP